MASDLIVAVIIMMCPKLSEVKDKYVIQGQTVNCMDYYNNDIVNHPDKYKRELEYVRTKRK